MDLKELIQKAHVNAKEKGFWEDWDFAQTGITIALKDKDERLMKTTSMFENNAIGNRLMLIVGELAEAQEGLRKKDLNNFKEELADVAIRLADLCGGLDIDLEAEIIKKMEKNKNRPYLHGKAF